MSIKEQTVVFDDDASKTLDKLMWLFRKALLDAAVARERDRRKEAADVQSLNGGNGDAVAEASRLVVTQNDVKEALEEAIRQVKAAA